MKIAMLGLRGIPATYGGIEKHVEELATRMAAMGHDVTVYCRSYYVNENIKNFKGVKLRKLPCINTKSLDASTHTLYASFDLLNKGFDIIHYHALGPSVFSIIPKIFGKKIVTTVHGLDWQREKWGLVARTFLKLGERTAVYVPNATVSVSKTLKKYLEEKYHKTVNYIPSAVNPPVFKEPDLITKEYGLKGNDYIFFIARLVPEKGAHFLLDAYAKLRPEMKLVIAGGSSHSDDYVEELHKKAVEGVIFTGYVYGELLHELWSNAYCYVHPSTMEGMPITIIEAANYGKCTIASDIPPNLEVVEDIGLTFPSGDVDALAAQLKKVLDDPQLASDIGARLKAKGVEEYSYDKIAVQTIELYKKVLGLASK